MASGSSSFLYWKVTGLSARIASLVLSIGLIASLKRAEEGAAKLTGGVYLNGCACNCCPIDARNKGFCLCSTRADANRPGFTSNTSVASIDIVIAGGEILTGSIAQCNIQVTG